MDQELLQAFYAEAEDIVRRLEADIDTWMRDPKNADLVNGLFRGLHTIKGNSSFLDLKSITELSHRAESVLDRVRKNQAPADSEVLELVLLTLDDLKIMIIEKDGEYKPEATVKRLDAYLAKGAAAPTTQAPASAATLAALGDILSGAPATSATPEVTAPIASAAEATASPAGVGDGVAKAVKASVAAPSLIRVEEGKVDKILALSQELELARNGLEGLLERWENGESNVKEELDSLTRKISRLSRSLAGIVHGVRLVPVNQVFQRFPRVVKDLAQKLNKSARLEVRGGETELDKSIVDAISEPMTHLIRNALDHGLESPEKRKEKGKNPEGVVTLSSYVRGSYVYIDIRDDGGGMDPNRIAAKAVEKGLATQEAVEKLSEQDKLAFIFAAGFSMAEKVTDISGRGVGMDVVRSNIQRLNGTVVLDSKVGEGTTVHLRFPLSTVVRYSLFVRSGAYLAAFPLEQAELSADYRKRDFLPPGGVRDPSSEVCLYSLKALLWNDNSAPPEDELHVVEFYDSITDRHVGFWVDEYVSTEEAVVHAVDAFLNRSSCVQGGTVRKDGSVCPVYDVDRLLALAAKKEPLALVRSPRGTLQAESSDNLVDSLLAG